MISWCGERYRFSSLLVLAFFLSARPSFADEELSSSASLSSNIITLGLAGFGLLGLYVGYLTVTFLIKTFKGWNKTRKEAAVQEAHTAHKTESQVLLSLIIWIGTLFSVIALGSLIITGFMAQLGADLSSATFVSKFLITIGCAGFSFLPIYIVFLTLAYLWKSFRRESETGAHGSINGDLASGLPLNPEMTRRSFLSLLGWAWVAFTAATMGALSTMLRFAFPNVTFEPPLKFTAGFPNTYSIGVDERFKDGHRVWIVRNDKGFYALSTICTHLGCTPNWLQAEQKFKCPCHGSGYYITGVNFEGPAPRPLERFQITLADDGQIVVDESIKFQQELGQWGMQGSFLEYKA